jgi:hypothetical protein
MELRVGRKYRLGRKIGSGSFGDIYLGACVCVCVASKLRRPLAGLPRAHAPRQLARPAQPPAAAAAPARAVAPPSPPRVVARRHRAARPAPQART